MSEKTNQPPTVIGISPWLPWPLSAWPWWTEPVRAERLALLRIGVALCLLMDIAYNYAPRTLALFGTDGLGDPAIFNWYFQPPRMTWSLLRGVGDDVTLYLSLTALLAASLWILGNSLARVLLIHRDPPADDRTGIALWIWSAALAMYSAGLWSQMAVTGTFDAIAWLVPMIGLSLACLFPAFDLVTRMRDPGHRIRWLPLLFSVALSCLLVVLGNLLIRIEKVDPTEWWARLLRPWQEDESLLVTAMVLWLASTFLLLLGLATRLSAVLCYLISMSFANANPHLDNAGDTIRLILLFYLMLCPCGAVWSLDALWQKRPKPVLVHPWPLRVLFVQMIFIYWINGIYKLFGSTWVEGSSLHYALGDVALARFSHVAFPMPTWMTFSITWTVLAWEASFPFLMVWKWSRRVALVFGVMFHLGIFASMELAGFVPYALCMYLPLLPWGEGNDPASRAP